MQLSFLDITFLVFRLWSVIYTVLLIYELKENKLWSGKMRFVEWRKRVLPEKLWNLHEIPKNKW